MISFDISSLPGPLTPTTLPFGSTAVDPSKYPLLFEQGQDQDGIVQKKSRPLADCAD
jgi:hypothetical protein